MCLDKSSVKVWERNAATCLLVWSTFAAATQSTHPPNPPPPTYTKKQCTKPIAYLRPAKHVARPDSAASCNLPTHPPPPRTKHSPPAHLGAAVHVARPELQPAAHQDAPVSAACGDDERALRVMAVLGVLLSAKGFMCFMKGCAGASTRECLAAAAATCCKGLLLCAVHDDHEQGCNLHC